MKSTLTKFLFYTYNLIKRNQIIYYYQLAKKYNENFSPRNSEIIDYLKMFDLENDLHNCKLISKKDIINYTLKVPKNKIVSWAYTGGSFGEPLKVPYSNKRNFVRTGTFKYFNELAGYKLGDSFALIRAKDKSKLSKFFRNETIVIPKDVSEKKLIDILNELKRKKVKVLVGYPTVMYELALVINKKPDIKKNLRIKSLISTSEMLDEEKRKFIYNTFNCNFVDRYSNEEVGLIAQQKEFNGVYYINNFGVYVEILDSNNNPVKTGQEGKVIVTDTNNDLIPMVRYDTGDFAIAGDYKNGCLFTIKKIIGRTTDKLNDEKNNPISSLALGPYIYKPLSNSSLNIQFQFVQIEKHQYILKLKSTKETIPETLEKEILDGLKSVLGNKSNIKIEFVEDILPLKSGKRPIYLNLINK